MSYRPFKSDSIGEIERKFHRFSENRTTLIHIREELQFRKGRRAKALLKDVEKAMLKGGEKVLPVGEPSPDKLIEVVATDNRDIDPRSPQARAAEVKIAELRRRLLDLSNRNRLVNFKHTSRGGRQIRVVSECLPNLYSIIEGDKPVEFIPLPPLPGEPEEEQKPEFISALEEALLTDKAYLKAVEKVEDESDDKAEFTIAKAERALRDRLRKALGWPTRSEIFSMSIVEHAKKLGIDPSYELTNQSPRRSKRRIHQWQTLLTEDELERRMRALEHQARESREEYGVETLYLVVGFLEWMEKTPGGEAEAPNLSPLLLVPLSIEKRQANRLSCTVNDQLLIEDGENQSNKHRDTYTIQGGADEASVNLCLRERLRQDFGLDLPEWNEELSVEVFLGQVQQAIADRPEWRIRSYATISHLAFNRLAMWADLDPEKPSVKPPHVHPVLGELFGGGIRPEQDGDGVHGEDAEAGVPSLILDCDSSQFAAIKAALGGRNLTIQGPPGTGKSQTIANLVASLLHQGKTVLFVAEKMAALDVVHSRLSDAGVGDFLLELHSAKASKKAVLESIRRRLTRRRRNDGEVGGGVAGRRKVLRDILNAYAAAINSPFGLSGMTVHEIIWQNYKYRNKPVPDRLIGYRLSEVGVWDKDAIESRCKALVQRVELERRYRDEQTGEEHPWFWVENADLHVEECDRLYHHVVDLLAKIEDLQAWFEKIQLVTLPSSYFALRTLANELVALGGRPKEITPGLWELSTQNNVVRTVETVIAAHQRRLQADQILTEVAPALLRATRAEVQELDRLTALAARVIPEVNAITDFERLAASKADNIHLLAQLDSAIKLMAQFRTVLAWGENVAEAELNVAALFIELASKAPNAITATHHNLGSDGQTALVRKKLEEMQACEICTVEFNSRLKIQVEALDHATLVKHRDELLRRGPFALFRATYREARAFCLNVFPDVTRDKRLSFLEALCELVALRNRLGADDTMRSAAGALFSGWETSKQNLLECCDWVDAVRQRTPIIDQYSGILRNVLFGLSQDHAGLAQKLNTESWPKILISLSDQCRRQSVALQDVRASIRAEQDAIDQAAEAMRSLEWQGPFSHERLNAASNALVDREEASGVLALHPSVLELLLPDPLAAIACIRAIAEAQLRVRSLPIQQAWRDRLDRADSVSDWADFQSLASSLDARLGAIESVMTKLTSLAATPPLYRENCERIPISAWAAALRSAAQAETMITTRAQLLTSKAHIETLGLEELVHWAHGPAMERFNGIADLFRALYLKSMAFQALEEHECLAEFRHASPDATREKFSQLDRELTDLHRQDEIASISRTLKPV